MLTSSYFNQQIHEKMIRAEDGRSFRVLFATALIDGELCWRVISATEICRLDADLTQNPRRKESSTLYLPSDISYSDVKDKGLRIKDSYRSPYFDNLKFFVSQMTRAPSSHQMRGGAESARRRGVEVPYYANNSQPI